MDLSDFLESILDFIFYITLTEDDEDTRFRIEYILISLMIIVTLIYFCVHAFRNKQNVIGWILIVLLVFFIVLSTIIFKIRRKRMELLQVFDKDRNILNESIARNKKTELPEGKYFMIILLFIQNSDGKFLIQKASQEKGGEYATTGGHVTFKDDGFITVLKECKEELGLELKENEVTLVDETSRGCCHINTYYVKKDIDLYDLCLQEEEVESVDWLSIEEINILINRGMFRKSHIKAFNSVLESKRK